ncbi:transcriptional regulator [Lactobacillus sp. CBA3605]|uniref:MarR family winged helix-turn-helix transcriptional regulator n=1 Tax=Lactobacillus sp. CBA3605 TaxID=2099788 RepID=UPI000CFAED02|nr:MarR family transcriptional regulator [Lactobacillus sp. CBA3605]AVK60951.1 transcriptional regulator [Lactobacillus sp. CBA3605]
METYNLSKLIAGIYRRSKNEFNQQISSLDMRATISDVILFINDHHGLSQKEIATAMGLDSSLLARNLKTLEQQALVSRHPNPNDHRAHQISLTTTGQTLADELRTAMTTWWTNLFNQHPEIDAATFASQLGLVFDSLVHSDD